MKTENNVPTGWWDLISATTAYILHVLLFYPVRRQVSIFHANCWSPRQPTRSQSNWVFGAVVKLFVTSFTPTTTSNNPPFVPSVCNIKEKKCLINSALSCLMFFSLPISLICTRASADVVKQHIYNSYNNQFELLPACLAPCFFFASAVHHKSILWVVK